MNELQNFFQLPIFKQLEQGQLPELFVTVDLKKETLLTLLVGIFLVGVAMMLTHRVILQLVA
jgi:hypothetical protein